MQKWVFWVCAVFLVYVVTDFCVFVVCNRTSHELVAPHLYKSVFVSNTFKAPRDEFVRNQYEMRVRRGFSVMRRRRIVFCALCRNVEPYLRGKLIQRIETTGNCFADYRVVIFENNSDDRTRPLLEAWSRRNRRVVLLDDEAQEKTKVLYQYGSVSNDRIRRMCRYRRVYHDYVTRKYADFDHVIVLDVDHSGGWALDGIADTFAREYKWDGVAANGVFAVPGTFGLIFIPYDGLAHKSRDRVVSRRNQIEFVRYYLEDLLSKRLYDKRRGDAWIRLQSAFNGMAIYKMEAFLRSRYRVRHNCEHIGFHETMQRFFLNPSLLLLSGRPGRPGFHVW